MKDNKMQWREESIILSVRTFSEASKIVTIFNRSIGKCAGLVKGVKASVQVGDICDILWRGKSIDHLGTFKIENIFSPLCYVFKDASKVFAIDSVCTLCRNGLPDRAAHVNLFESLKIFLLSLSQRHWVASYVFFEISMLSEIGYGLSLTKCAVSGEKEGLRYVSPKTGRAVTEKIGQKYGDRLFPLPQFMISRDINPTEQDISYAINITGHFLKMYFDGINAKPLPISREYIFNLEKY